MIGLTQRVTFVHEQQERRDSLAQRWVSLVHSCGFVPYLIPNFRDLIPSVLNLPLQGIILTNGNTLHTDAPERDEIEMTLLEHAIEHAIPILGVCRGMQIILHYFGASLEKISGHVAPSHVIRLRGGEMIEVNSFHDYGTFAVPHPLEIIGTAQDGVVEAIRHPTLPIEGIMWHPERNTPFHRRDQWMIGRLFGQKR